MYKPDNTPTVLLETLYLSHPKITETPMVGIIIETPDTAKSVATKNILKTSIPPKKGYAHGEERQDRKNNNNNKKKNIAQ